MRIETRLTHWLAIVCAVLLSASGRASANPTTFVEVGRDILNTGVEGGFATADVDGDGIADLVFVGNSYPRTLLTVGRRADGSIGFKQILPLPPGPQSVTYRRVLSADVAGTPHIYVVTQDGVVDDYAGWPLAKVGSFAVTGPVSSAVIGQPYADGSNQLLVLTQDMYYAAARVYAYALDTHQPLWSYEVAGAKDLVLGQLDADAAQEIVVNSSPGLILDSLTRATDGQYAGGPYGALATGHTLGDGTTQLIAASAPYTGFSVYGGSPLSPLWSTGVVYDGGIQYLASADIDHNGRDVIIEADSQWGTVNAFDPTTHQQRFAIPKVGNGISAMAVKDFDGDDVPDIVFSVTYPMNDAGIVIADGATGLKKWSYVPHPASFQNVAIGDVDGDGAQELVVADYGSDQLRGVEIFDFASGTLEWESGLTSPGGLDPLALSTSRVLLVPHANGVGQDIVLAGKNNYVGKIAVLDGVTHEARMLVGQAPALTQSRALVDAALVDFDLDGKLDYAVAGVPTDNSVSGAKVFVFSGVDGSLLWASPPITSGGSGIVAILVTGPASSSSSKLVVVQRDGMIAYNLQTHAVDWTLSAEIAGATYFPNDPEGPSIAIFRTSGDIRLYDAATGSRGRGFSAPYPLNAMLPLDANHVLISSDNALGVLELPNPSMPACTRYLSEGLGIGNRLAASDLGGGLWMVASANRIVYRHALSIDTIFTGGFTAGSRQVRCMTVF
jgi:hypothetical protein